MISCDVSVYLILKTQSTPTLKHWTSSIVLLVHQGGHIGFANDNMSPNYNYIQGITHNCQNPSVQFQINPK